MKEKLLNKDVLENLKKYFETQMKGLNDTQKKLYILRLTKYLRENDTNLIVFLKVFGINDEYIRKLDTSLAISSLISIMIEASRLKKASGLTIQSLLISDFSKKDDTGFYFAESDLRFKNVLENYKKLSIELGINSSLDLSNLFTLLLWDGYFSVNKKHEYSLDNRMNIRNRFAYDVINGQGVCLAYADLLQKYLKVCDVDNILTCCYVPTTNGLIDIDKSLKIKRNVDKESCKPSSFSEFLLNPIMKKFGNHAIVLINDSGNLYGYDPTNLAGLIVRNEDTGVIVNGKGRFNIKPWGISMYLDSSFIDSGVFDILSQEKINSNLTKEEFCDSFFKTSDLFKSNSSLIDDVYDNIHGDLSYINNKSLRYMKRK